MTSVPASPDDGLFPDDTPPAAGQAAPVRPEWERVTALTLRCDRCIREFAAARGHGRRPAAARWRHRTSLGDVLYCYPHAREVRGG